MQFLVPLLSPFLLLNLLQFTNAQSFTCSVGSGEACPVAFCPGDEVTYTCDVGTALGSTIWSFSKGSCSPTSSFYNQIVLLQSSVANCYIGSYLCHAFTATNVYPGANQPACTVSLLTVDLDKALNNTVIQCLNVPLLGTSVEIGSATLVKEDEEICFCSKLTLKVLECTATSVTLMWETLKITGSPVSQYYLSSSPPVDNCNPNCTVGPSTSQYKFIGLEAEMRYNLSLRADICERKQQGVESVIENIYIPNIKKLNLYTCGVYSGTVINAIESTWIDLPSLFLSAMELLCDSVLYYNITYANSWTSSLIVLPLECSSGECSHTLAINGGVVLVDNSATEYSVSVTAILNGLEVTSGTKTVANVLLVEVSTISSPVMATCSFLSGFTGDALCRVDFTGPDGVTYTSVSTERGSAGESVTVELTLNGAALLPSTTYSYQATLEDPSDESMCVKGIGQFTTEQHNDCNIKDLGTSASDSSECGEGEMAGDIPNGMWCYTGLTPGSTAAYSCDKGYELNGTSVLVCLTSGMWNESQPMCASSAPVAGSQLLLTTSLLFFYALF